MLVVRAACHLIDYLSCYTYQPVGGTSVDSQAMQCPSFVLLDCHSTVSLLADVRHLAKGSS